MKKKTYKIIICISLVVMLFTSFGNVFGATNPEYTPKVNVSENALDTKIKGDILTDVLANMLNTIASIVEYLIGGIFSALTGDNIFPWADRIIFNGIGFLDINFLNPADNSLFVTNGSDSILGQVVKQVYSSIFSLAVLFLGVAVGVMAIRLAISSIAAEKAKYKQAIVNWATCLVMLFLMHYILAFVFWINEQLVRVASGILIQTIETNKLNSINFKDVLNDVVDPKTRVENYISTAFAATKEDTSTLENNVEITNALLQNEDYIDRRVKYTEDSGKSWWDSIWQAVTGQGNMVGDIGLKRLAYDVNDAVAISKLSDSAKSQAKEDGYYSVNNHKIFINKAAYLNDRNGEYKRDLAGYCMAKVKHTDASTVYQTYKNNPWLKIDDPSSPNLWQAWSTELTYTWVASISNSLSDAFDWSTGAAIKDIDELVSVCTTEEFEETLGEDNVNKVIKARIDFDNDIIQASNLNTGAEATDIIAGLASFFKQSAYIYTTEDVTTGTGNKKEVVTGWRASRVSVTGALLYAIFIFQSCMYLIMYVKRLFYVMMLSMFGPIVVIYDFFMKSAS